MSRDEPQATPCSEVLDKVYAYIDGELEEDGCTDIRKHLEECGSCLEEYGLEEAVKRVVAKCCGCDPAPEKLRAKVLNQLAEACGDLRSREALTE
ncbi:mycothiol system anti-sigma-R factor [Actinorugispora endophytica]|uniref:Mycothiol system anti-sigma-R factor n=1 Tax=Actinorugispora endophytica TaxID=1605990 RepID=A0A4R6V7I9_9ACTN|nr:mycothiol system anti-sigma-R factor [Actinorugispora endophytica]TDQ54688.1 mycothiol system anti-sigma-R factor [Actinorugispora endophytica]